MKSEDPFGLRPLWDASLEIYREIAKICDRHGLRYYATDGTALGAVRHKGFIPWDDDLDMSMPRPDYEKFKKIAAKELPSDLRFWDFRDEPKALYLFGKVQCTEKDRVLALEKRLGRTLSNGLFVDIFPIDGYPKGVCERIKIRIVTGILACIVKFRCTHFLLQTKKGRIAWLLGLLLCMFCPWVTQRHCLLRCERYLQAHKFDKSMFSGRSCSSLSVLRRAPLRSSCWGNGKIREFDGTSVKVPDDVDAYLKNEYNKWDYMQLPPEKDRHPTHGFPHHFPWWLGPKDVDITEIKQQKIS